MEEERDWRTVGGDPFPDKDSKDGSIVLRLNPCLMSKSSVCVSMCVSVCLVGRRLARCPPPSYER